MRVLQHQMEIFTFYNHCIPTVKKHYFFHDGYKNIQYQPGTYTAGSLKIKLHLQLRSFSWNSVHTLKVCLSISQLLSLAHTNTHTMLSNWSLMGRGELIMDSLCSGSRPDAGDLIRALTGASAIAALIWGVICLDNVQNGRKRQRWQETGGGRL